ncbi:MAG: malonyl-ACP O-methyltransferase BioC [Methylococcaceae bacterium]|nr:malonyl-ACP O-methyltransferase BioC [Methylococcaceae bacterium]
MISVLDKKQIQQSFGYASQSYDGMATLQRRVGRQLINKVSLANDALVLDVGCGTGFFTQQLREVAGLENILALDIALPMLLKAQQRVAANVPLICADAEQLPFIDHCVAGVVSNLALQWCANLDVMFVDVKRVLQSKGQFVFSTFGASALHELKTAWAVVDDYPHVNEFFSLAEIGAKLQAAGFVDVQLERRIYRNKYASVIELMRELKGIGAHNVSHQRNKALTSKGQIQAMCAAYPVDTDGQITASFEIIYVQVRNKG